METTKEVESSTKNSHLVNFLYGNPNWFSGIDTLYKEVAASPGFEPWEKEHIMTLVAAQNECKFCMDIHSTVKTELMNQRPTKFRWVLRKAIVATSVPSALLELEPEEANTVIKCISLMTMMNKTVDLLEAIHGKYILTPEEIAVQAKQLVETYYRH